MQAVQLCTVSTYGGCVCCIRLSCRSVLAFASPKTLHFLLVYAMFCLLFVTYSVHIPGISPVYSPFLACPLIQFSSFHLLPSSCDSAHLFSPQFYILTTPASTFLSLTIPSPLVCLPNLLMLSVSPNLSVSIPSIPALSLSQQFLTLQCYSSATQRFDSSENICRITQTRQPSNEPTQKAAPVSMQHAHKTRLINNARIKITFFICIQLISQVCVRPHLCMLQYMSRTNVAGSALQTMQLKVVDS